MQPMLLAVGYALARAWMRSGIGPEAMIGHSLGEYVAARRVCGSIYLDWRRG